MDDKRALGFQFIFSDKLVTVSHQLLIAWVLQPLVNTSLEKK